tara:strand:- start:1152 stop:1523 length:372 start_codon:yes stop_codon:yes gene_type:complete
MSKHQSRVCHHDSDLQTRTKSNLDKQLAESRDDKRTRISDTFISKRKRPRIGQKIEVYTRSFDIPIAPNRFTTLINNYVNTLAIPDKYKEESIINDYKLWLDKVSKHLPKGHVYKEIYINLNK